MRARLERAFTATILAWCGAVVLGGSLAFVCNWFGHTAFAIRWGIAPAIFVTGVVFLHLALIQLKERDRVGIRICKMALAILAGVSFIAAGCYYAANPDQALSVPSSRRQ